VLPMNQFRGFKRFTPLCFVLRRPRRACRPSYAGLHRQGRADRPPLVRGCQVLNSTSSIDVPVMQCAAIGASPLANGQRHFCHASELRIDIDQDVDVVGPKFTLNQDAERFLGNLGGDLFEPRINADQDFAPIFGAPDHLALARTGHVALFGRPYWSIYNAPHS
jgi:hypothetical protein